MKVLADERLTITTTIADGMGLRDYPNIRSKWGKLYLIPAFDGLCVEDIAPDDVQQLFNNMSGAKTTKDKAKVVLNQILDAAVEDGLLPKSPLKSKRIKIKPLSYTQVRRMCSRIKRDLEFEENITPIRFRTTFLTDLYEQTGDIKLAQKEAGHTTPAMTLKYYVKGRKTSEDAAIAIERVYTAS